MSLHVAWTPSPSSPASFQPPPTYSVWSRMAASWLERGSGSFVSAVHCCIAGS
ncbi:MAG: hypothetical protein WDN28_09245 [Chthoniobacter sp.]